MSRAGLAFTTLILPGFAFSFLLTLGERGWIHCFAFADMQPPPPIPSLFDWPEALPVLVDTLAAPFATPGLAALHFAPTALFAIFLWHTAPGRKRRIFQAGLLVFLVFGFWLLWPAATPLDCGSSGPPDALVRLGGLSLAGGLAALFTNKINCMTGACQ